MKLLLVDDHEPFVNAVITTFLHSHHVVRAATIAAARRELARDVFDAILVDFDLPDGKGDHLVAEIRARSNNQVVIAISAHEDGNASLLRAGATRACPKTQFKQIRSVLDEIARPPDPKVLPTVLSFSAPDGPKNEDRLLVARPLWGLVVAVADGAGGSGAGAFAAQTAIEQVDRRVAAAPAPLELPDFAELLTTVDNVLVESKTGGETTLVVAQIANWSVTGASVGDSGAMHIRTSRTFDLTARQSRKPLLGSGYSAPAIFGPAELDGLLLVATDGLIKYAPRTAFARAMAAPDLVAARDILVGSVRLRSGDFHDDTTGILVRR